MRADFYTCRLIPNESRYIRRFENRDPGRLHGIRRKNRPEWFQIENGSQKGGTIPGRSRHKPGFPPGIQGQRNSTNSSTRPAGLHVETGMNGIIKNREKTKLGPPKRGRDVRGGPGSAGVERRSEAGRGPNCQARSKRPIRGLECAGLRRLSRRGSWVQIPPPAPFPNLRTFTGEGGGIRIPPTEERIPRVEY